MVSNVPVMNESMNEMVCDMNHICYEDQNYFYFIFHAIPAISRIFVESVIFHKFLSCDSAVSKNSTPCNTL